MNTPDPLPPVAIPWWQSKIIRRLLLSILVQLIAITHSSKLFAGADLSALVDALLELAGILYAAWAMHARATKPQPVLVSTQAKADTANSEVQQ